MRFNVPTVATVGTTRMVETTTERSHHTGWSIVGACVVGIAATLPMIPAGGLALWPLSVSILLFGLALCFGAWDLIKVLVVGGVVASLMLPAFTGDGLASTRTRCENNLRQIGIAINLYEYEHGHYPPPFTTDENGRPLHSWRVLILPYLEMRDLFDQIDLTKPWNHPDNLRFADAMPQVFDCPKATESSPTFTTAYVAVTGHDTVWRPDATVSTRDVPDGTSKTVLVIECEAARTHWMAPNDVLFDDIVPVETTGETMLLSGPHPNSAVIVFCDGHVQYVSNKLRAQTIRSLCSRNGNDDDNADIDRL